MLGSWTSKEISEHDEWTITHLKLLADCVPPSPYLGSDSSSFQQRLSVVNCEN